MKNKFFRNIDKKSIIIILSIVLSTLCVYILLIIAARIYYISWINTFMRNIKYRVGIYRLTIGTGIILFFIFFFLMNRFLLAQKKLKYAHEISKEIQKIAQGKFDIKIPIRSSDELGKLAENINKMANQLKTSIEDERNAEKTKNELITSISHDLRTPLTSILGYLGLIVNGQYKDEVHLMYYADIAHEKSHKLKKLIDELFEFTRLSHGSMKIQTSSINLLNLFKQLVEELFPIFQDAKMESRLLGLDDKIYILGDGDMLVRAFENIIVNAIRYGKDGKYVDIELKQKNSLAIINITNYGSPIPKAYLPYIFEKFYRIEQSRSEATGGTGLGLAIAKNIIELHSGKISVQSNNEKTTFKICFKTHKTLDNE